jgi:polyphosphate glucokinase
MRVLTIDIGGTNIKILATGEHTSRRFPSGPELTPKQMVFQVRKLAEDWRYDAVSIGYPGPVHRGRPVAEPRNLGKGWVGFNFAGAFGRPVKIINDAAMQALGSYKGGLMLFVGLGTGIGSAIVAQGILVPLELGHFPYKNGTCESYFGAQGLKRLGKKKWQRHVENGVAALIAAVQPDDVVLGGGNVKKLRALPPACRAGHNAFAFVGGFRLREEARHAVDRRPRAKGKLKLVSSNRRRRIHPQRAPRVRSA